MDIQGHINVENKMIKDEELKNIIGGKTSVSGTLVNAGMNVIKQFFGFGQYFGSAIRRLAKKKMCVMD